MTPSKRSCRPVSGRNARFTPLKRGRPPPFPEKGRPWRAPPRRSRGAELKEMTCYAKLRLFRRGGFAGCRRMEPTSAFAWAEAGMGAETGGWHGGWGGTRFFIGGPVYEGTAAATCVTILVPTPWGTAMAPGQPSYEPGRKAASKTEPRYQPRSGFVLVFAADGTAGGLSNLTRSVVAR